MKQSINFGVITSTYNRKRYLKECIESVARTNLTGSPVDINFTHYIYDDGSSDGTKELLHKIEKKYSHVHVFYNNANKGFAYGQDYIVRNSPQCTHYIQIDDDDILLSRTLCYFADAIHNFSNYDWFSCDFVRSNQIRRYIPGNDYFGWQFKNAREMLQSIFNATTFLQTNVCYSRELYMNSGGFDHSLRMADDLDLYIRFLLTSKKEPKYINFISHIHRNHKTNVSRNVGLEEHKKDVLRLYMKYRIKLESLGIYCPFTENYLPQPQSI